MSPITMNNPADEISQKEKREVMRNDRLNTYQAHAAASVDEERGGRFSVQTKLTVIGQSPITYPQQPQTSPANQAALVGDEAPLGYSVENHEPVGEPHERTEPAAPTDPAPVSVRLRRRI